MSGFRRFWHSFSFFGLVCGSLFFAISVSPSLLPRPFVVQGILSGFAIALGYSLGVLLVFCYRFLELPKLSESIQRVAKTSSVLAVAIIFVGFLWRMTYWQNSIRERMEMPTLESGYPYRIAAIALLVGVVLIGLTRIVLWIGGWTSNRLNSFLPRRVSIVLSTIIVSFLVVFVGNGVIARGLLSAADSFFLYADERTDEGIEKPSDPLATGSDESLISWDTIGRRGKQFIAAGPTKQEIEDFLGGESMQPIRVYSGMRSADTPLERALLALEELKRVKAFERSLLVIATPTGTGWLDPGAVDTLEYLHGGDTAIVTEQYSYLPSWITILVDPRRSIESAEVLFQTVYAHWKTLPKDARPKLYLHGLSLGSLGGEVSADLLTTFEDPIQGALWSGPPFPSTQWQRLVAQRVSGSPLYLPRIGSGRTIRFTAQQNALNTGQPWGSMRVVYIQYASDPMIFFSPSLLYEKPAWLQGTRGPDVSPYLTWYPLITFLQIAFDLPMATSIPTGYGHNYSPAHYIDGWVAVTDPPQIDPAKERELKRYFATKKLENGVLVISSDADQK
jgi:uncharacterized membrane protein